MGREGGGKKEEGTLGGRPPLQTEAQLLEYLDDIYKLEDERQKLRGMVNYVPNKMQLRAHQSNARTILYCGGNRAGKSTFGAIEICFAMTKRYPDWYPLSKRFRGPVKAVVSATSFAIVMRVIESKLMALMPREEIVSIKRTAQSFPSQIRTKDGSTLDILTLEMDDSAYESADWDIAWLDEPQNQRKYQAILRGLVDRRGRILITFTPLTEPWMKEELADRADGKNIDLFTVDMRDNMFTIDGSPILSSQAIKEFEAEIPEDVKETRLHGKFFHLRGVVYQEFGDYHILNESEMKYDGRSPVICVLDPHDRVPHHVIWAWIDRDDDIHVDYEWDGHLELDELAQTIMSIEKKRGYNMKRRLIDPNFGRKPSRVGTNKTVIQELSSHSCRFYEANDNIELGHMIVRDYLHFDHAKPVTAVNKPKLFFSKERCPKTIRSMRNLQYEDWTGKNANDKDPKEREKDKENHGADCIRYLCISKPKSRSASFEFELSGAPY